MYFHVHVCPDLNESISTCLCLGRHDQIQSWTVQHWTKQVVRYHHENTNLRMDCVFPWTCICSSQRKYKHMPVLGKTWSETIMNRTVQNWTNQLVRYHHKNTNIKMISAIPCTCLCWSQWKYQHMPVLGKTWSDKIMNRTVQNWTKQLVRYHHETLILRWSLHLHVHVCADLNENISTCLCLGRHDQIQS